MQKHKIKTDRLQIVTKNSVVLKSSFYSFRKNVLFNSKLSSLKT